MAASKEQWCKVLFHVQVNKVSDEFDCECRYFNHSGLLCPHALKVMIHLGYKEIPGRYILKRWTRDARDILPPHLMCYQRDKVNVGPSSYRHSSLHLTCLEVSSLGDSNVECYNLAMREMTKLVEMLKPISRQKDDLGIDEREKDNEAEPVSCDATGNEAAPCADGVPCRPRGILVISAPDKHRPMGRPNIRHDKPPYEGHEKRTRFCSICRNSDTRTPPVRSVVWCRDHHMSEASQQGTTVLQLWCDRP